MPSLFDRIGGFGPLSRIVLSFYDHVLDDDLLAPYFDGVDMRRLVDHQTKFMAYLMGGPASYSDDQLRIIHAHLQIDGPAVDRLIEVLRSTLDDFDLAARDIDEIANRMAAKRHLIVVAVAS